MKRGKKTMTDLEFNDDLNELMRRSDLCVLTWADEHTAQQVIDAFEPARLVDIWGSTLGAKGSVNSSTSRILIGSCLNGGQPD